MCGSPDVLWVSEGPDFQVAYADLFAGAAARAAPGSLRQDLVAIARSQYLQAMADPDRDPNSRFLDRRALRDLPLDPDQRRQLRVAGCFTEGSEAACLAAARATGFVLDDPAALELATRLMADPAAAVCPAAPPS